MAPEVWHDINEPSGLPPQEKEEEKRTAPAAEPEPEKEKSGPEFRISSAAITVPADGLKQDQPFDFECAIEPVVEKITKPRLLADAVTRYKDKEEFIDRRIEFYVDDSGSCAKGTCKKLIFPADFLSDRTKAPDAKFKLFLKISGEAAQKECTSDAVLLPTAAKEIILKKGKYDDTWANSTGEKEKYPKNGDDYIPGEKIKKLQEDLWKFRLMEKERATGYFGDMTEKAVKEFQEYAKGTARKKANDIRVFRLESGTVTYQGATSGEVDEKTEKEIAVWIQENYVKPEPEYRKDDYDREGKNNNPSADSNPKRDPHYYDSREILDFQQLLKDVGAYAGKIDGWIGDITHAALKLFQEHAEKGEFADARGNKVMLDEKDRLSGHREGVGCGKTIAAAKQAKEKGLKVPGKIALSDSVGKAGKNTPEDVIKVKQRLQDLGYPISKIDAVVDDETVNSIKLFQIAYQVIETGEDTSNPTVVPFPDGLISKGQKTETWLFSDSPKKYESPVKETEKPISVDCKEKIDLSAGENKTKWEKIIKIWKNVSPYLPSGSSMTSGYRSAEEQRTLLYNFYNVKYKDKIIKKYSKAEWQKYYDLEGTNNSDSDTKILQMVRACGQKIAAPGSSPHQKGIAIDIGGIGDQKQCRALLWCSVMRPGGIEITKILPEVNGCVHFEFKP